MAPTPRPIPRQPRPGRATINAVDADSGARGSATITVNAGAAESVAVTAVPTTVSSGGTAMITATITDALGNGVGGQTLSATANNGTVGDFTEGAAMGDYTAEYTAPTVDAASTDVVTVTSGLLIGVATVDLTPEPPMSVGILVVSGTVNKSGGSGAAAGVNVAVSVRGGNAANRNQRQRWDLRRYYRRLERQCRQHR